MKNKTIKTVLKVVIPLAIGILILWALYRNIKPQEILNALEHARVSILLSSLIFGLLANIVRGLRWDILIRSLGEKPRRINSILTTLGNYAVNMGIPRTGEVWRCGAMGYYSNIGFSKLLGTLLVDRVSDVVIVAFLVAIAGLFNIDFFTTFFAKNHALVDHISGIFGSPIFYIGLIVLSLIIFLIFKFLHHSTIVQKAIGFFKNIWLGLKSIAMLEQKWLFILYSILLWVGYFFFFYTTFFAFDFTAHLGMRIGLLAFIMSSIAVAAPVQNGLGPWHFMVIYTLMAFGVKHEDAGAFAFIVHTTQTLWITLCGVVAIWILSLINKGEPHSQIHE